MTKKKAHIKNVVLPHMQDRIWRESVAKQAHDLLMYHKVSPAVATTFADSAVTHQATRVASVPVKSAGRPSPLFRENIEP